MYELKVKDIGFVAGRWPLDPSLHTILFIHGSGGTNILWHSQVEALADMMNTVALDLPGHGKSDGEGMSRVEDYAMKVSAFIKSIEARQPVLCGLSIGGAIVLQLLLDSQEQYKAGILVNTGARLKVMPLIFETIEKDYEGYINSLHTVGASEKTDPSKLKPLADSMVQCPPSVALGDFTACHSFDVMEQIQKINIPVLVMTASDDKLTPVKYGTYLANKIRHAAITNIEDAGHLSPIEKPEAVTQVIREFMASLNNGTSD